MYENKEEYPEWYLICLLFTSHTVSRCRTFDARVFPKNKKNYPQNTRVRQTLMSKSSRPPCNVLYSVTQIPFKLKCIHRILKNVIDAFLDF